MMSEFPAYESVKSQLHLREKVGQLFMPAAFINDTEAEIGKLESLIETGQVGGLCFFHSRASAATNFEGPKAIPYNENSLSRLKQLIERYQRAARIPLLMAIDAEWGLAMRVERAPQYPYALTLGALNHSWEHLLYDLGLRMAQDCHEIGIHLNLTPVADTNTNPENPVIGYRAFGSHPEAVGRKASLLHQGLADGGLLSCAKHFPGHGDTAVDSHLNLPVLHKSLSDLEQEELLPFKALIKAQVPLVMTGHLSLPQLDPSGLPASLSQPIIGLLRDMEFEGTIITDALNMHALKGISSQAESLNLQAVQAGNDILCYADRIPESISLILKELSESRIETSFKRVWDLKARLFPTSAKSVLPNISPNALNQKLAQHCLCALRDTEEVLAEFRKDGFTQVSVGQTPHEFIKKLQEAYDFETHTCPSGVGLQKGLGTRAQNILITLWPPYMKPKDFFGLPSTLIAELRALGAQKNLVLYLFGNPYILKKLPLNSFGGIVCASQPQSVFQEVAGQHFSGYFKATGELPIDLDYDN
ncbi:MAG: glycoside hydrolase family 3 N-terminal domain-containing protein [Robiginitalea sp.]|uniref:glycoside hydrolase family 3 protein n=1 Tax=Robiginitalea sp. TaxID=1902411 RepID=UPI003C746B99